MNDLSCSEHHSLSESAAGSSSMLPPIKPRYTRLEGYGFIRYIRWLESFVGKMENESLNCATMMDNVGNVSENVGKCRKMSENVGNVKMSRWNVEEGPIQRFSIDPNL